jgi:hypothetical protein
VTFSNKHDVASVRYAIARIYGADYVKISRFQTTTQHHNTVCTGNVVSHRCDICKRSRRNDVAP